MTHNGSYWFDSLDAPYVQEAPTPLPAAVDVAIIGGGYTGLWTAYYLSELNPSLKIAVLEAETFGFGASGRNGGWCMGTAHGVETLLARPESRGSGLALARAMQATVDEIGQVTKTLDIDCHFKKGGNLTVATQAFHVPQLQAELQHLRELGFSEDDYAWLPAGEAQQRVQTQQNFGALFTPHCAAIHPARLVRGLAASLAARGVECVASTRVTEIKSGLVKTDRGEVRAKNILRATEGYTGTIKGQQRRVLPIYSMMVATEPLPSAVWQQIGLSNRETFGDPRRVVIYGQRTQDDRLAFGGRAGYFYGSKIKHRIALDDAGPRAVAATLRQLFPVLNDYQITHGWGGPLGVNRHWRPCVSFDAKTGIGTAGGYVGEGVAAANLAARILADLVLNRATEITQLPWVNDHARGWEIEPIRYFGAKTLQFCAERADAQEARLGKPAGLWATVFDAVVD
ncbi:MAG: FAD-dependent oxidoreductase [Gammaproteobacteria bacterium]|jgi:glycine/D-amino acid oxidase-like deaminating enzyme|nr:FAD-dependent oxidoreductase [Gammaproteobacteria bacterium]